MVGRRVVPVWAAFLVGCGASSGTSTVGSLDCSWAAGNNCWKTVTAAAVSCLPPSTELGVLSGDNSTCTYASGDVVTFTPPVVFPFPNKPTWNFSVAGPGGVPCLQYREMTTKATLTAGGQTITFTPYGSAGFELTCPDGTSYATLTVTSLLSCGYDAGNSEDPSYGYSDSSSGSGSASVSFTLSGTSMPTGLQVFSCKK